MLSIQSLPNPVFSVCQVSPILTSHTHHVPLLSIETMQYSSRWIILSNQCIDLNFKDKVEWKKRLIEVFLSLFSFDQRNATFSCCSMLCPVSYNVRKQLLYRDVVMGSIIKSKHRKFTIASRARKRCHNPNWFLESATQPQILSPRGKKIRCFLSNLYSRESVRHRRSIIKRRRWSDCSLMGM